MFSKDNSSIQSAGSGKKGKDVPLRKSDRRHLRQRVTSVLQTSDPQDTARLDAVFLQGTLLTRQLVLPSEKVTLYVRNPSSIDHDNNDNAAARDDENRLLWPYTESPQVVWIEVDHGPRQEKSQIPSLALLSILDCFMNNNDDNNNDNNNPPQHGLPLVSVPYIVSKYLCRGAHLMKSGMRGLTNVKDWQQQITQQQHTVAAVVIQGNPQPVAVGWLSPSIQSLADFGPGHKGEGLHVVTSYGDDLWKQQKPIKAIKTTTAKSASSGEATPTTSRMGANYNNGDYGNIGFVDGKYAVPLVMDGGDAAPPDLQDEEEDGDESQEGKEEKEVSNGTAASAVVGGDAGMDETETSPTAENTVPLTKEEEEQDDASSSSSQPSPEEILHEAVCKALARLSPKKDLPMTVSVFYAQHVLHNRREGTTIQLKQTRYKKFGPYLSEQVENGLLKVGPDAAKKDPMAMLVEYNRKHPDLKPYLEAANNEKTEEARNEGSRLVLLDLFAVPHHFIKPMRLDADVVKAANATSEQRRNTGFLTAKEMKAILEDYISRENLVHPQQPSKIILDGPLTDALFKKKSKDGAPAPTEVTRKELAVAWQEKMEKAFALVQLPGSEIINMGRGKGPSVTMEVSKRNNKKFVTRIRGMEDFGIPAADLQRQIAHRFACAASIEEDPHQKLKKGHFELVLQGNLVDEVEALLIGDESLTSHGGAKDSPYRIPKNAIEVILRKGVPARKGRSTSGKKN